MTKVMIQFEATEEFRDEILEASKKEGIQFKGFIRKILREYLEAKRIK